MQENERMNGGEGALVQSEERKHPHFSQFEIKAYKESKIRGFGEMDDKEYRIWLRWWRMGWRRVTDSGVCEFDG